jgi:hypothetical protein
MHVAHNNMAPERFFFTMYGQTPPLGGMLVWLWVAEAQNQRNVLLPAWLISRVIHIIFLTYKMADIKKKKNRAL